MAARAAAVVRWLLRRDEAARCDGIILSDVHGSRSVHSNWVRPGSFLSAGTLLRKGGAVRPGKLHERVPHEEGAGGWSRGACLPACAFCFGQPRIATKSNLGSALSLVSLAKWNLRTDRRMDASAAVAAREVDHAHGAVLGVAAVADAGLVELGGHDVAAVAAVAHAVVDDQVVDDALGGAGAVGDVLALDVVGDAAAGHALEGQAAVAELAVLGLDVNEGVGRARQDVGSRQRGLGAGAFQFADGLVET